VVEVDGVGGRAGDGGAAGPLAGGGDDRVAQGMQRLLGGRCCCRFRPAGR
jgi:hypothetical protein